MHINIKCQIIKCHVSREEDAEEEIWKARDLLEIKVLCGLNLF